MRVYVLGGGGNTYTAENTAALITMIKIGVKFWLVALKIKSLTK